MPDEIISTSPESTDINALKVAVYGYNYPVLGSIKVPYGAIVDMPTYAIVLTGSTVGANKNHLTLFNGSTRKLRIRKIEASANITGTVAGAIIMLTVQGITNPAPVGGTDMRTPEQVRPYSTVLNNADPLPITVEVRAAPITVTVVPNYHLILPRPLHIEESVTTTGDSIILYDKYNEISSIQLENNQGITIQQGTAAGAGALNLAIYLTPD